MINNTSIQLLFDWRGTISRNQYWIGLIFLFILAETPNFSVLINELIDKFIASLPLTKQEALVNKTHCVSDIISGIGVRFSSIFYFLPSVAHVSLAVITVKRAKAFEFKPSKVLFLFFSSYLLFYFATNTDFLLIYLDFALQSGSFVLYSASLQSSLFAVSAIVVGILTVITLSGKTAIDHASFQSEYPNNAIVKLGLLTSLFVIVCNSIWLSEVIDSTLLIFVYSLAVVVILIILGLYLKIGIQLSKQAKLNANRFIALFAAVLLLAVSSTLIKNRLFNSLLDCGIYSLLSQISVIAFFVLALYTYYLLVFTYSEKENGTELPKG